MTNKKFLIKRLMEYPQLSQSDYISLIQEKNNLIQNNHLIIDVDVKINDLDKQINLYNEKQMLIDLIKNTSPVISPVTSIIPVSSFFRPPSF